MSVLSRRCVFNLLFSDNNSLDLVVEVKEEAIKNFAEYRPNIILLDKDDFLSVCLSTKIYSKRASKNTALSQHQNIKKCCIKS